MGVINSDAATKDGRPLLGEGARTVVKVDAQGAAYGRRFAPWMFAILACVSFFYLFSSILMPFAAGITLGYLLDPLADRLQKMGFNRLGAALFILAAFLLFLVLALVVIAPVLGHQLANFIEAAPRILARLQVLLVQSADSLVHSWAGDFLSKYGVFPSADQSPDTQKWASDLISGGAAWAGSIAKSVLSGGAALFGVVSLLIITPVVAFYILVDWQRMIATVQSLIPPRLRNDAEILARDIDRALAGFVRGQSLVCGFLGLWYGLGLSLIGLNFGFLIGAAAGALSFIPYVGSLSALVVSAIVAIVQDWPSWMLLIKAVGIVAVGQFMEGNFLSPKLVGESVGLHPVWLMFALLAGGSLLGFTGLLIAVPLAAAIGVLLRHVSSKYRQSPFFLGTHVDDASSATIIVENERE